MFYGFAINSGRIAGENAVTYLSSDNDRRDQAEWEGM